MKHMVEAEREKKTFQANFALSGKIPCNNFMFIGSSAHRIKLSKLQQIRKIARKLSYDKNDFFLFVILRKSWGSSKLENWVN